MQSSLSGLNATPPEDLSTDARLSELGRIVAADSCAVLSQKADVREAYLGGHSTQGISGTSQRWKRRKTWR